MTQPLIRVRDAELGYQGVAAVRADLSVLPGEVVAVLGPNGSGKTTLVKGALGLVECLRGTVELFSTPLARFRQRSLIGYVPQRQGAAGPIPVTVQELVRSGRLTARGVAGRWSRADAVAIAAAIDAVGLTELAGRPVATLSGGQQRRALIARGIAGEPRLLVLDEPLAGIDQANQDAIASTLRSLVAGGCTIVVVLHELGPLEPLVTRVVCMDRGRVLFDGPLSAAPPHLLHLGHDHDPHGDSSEERGGLRIGLTG